MGRTKRKRSLRHLESKNSNLDHQESTINLRKWLKENKLSDPLNLRLRNFTCTGRGVTSKKSVKGNDVLMRVPLDLLITFDTVEKSGLLQCLGNNGRFSTQTLITFYLAVEKHKGERSVWKNYIDTLPYPEPSLPWMCQNKEMLFFPEDLKPTAIILQDTFAKLFLSLRKSIRPTALCDCCKNPMARVLGTNLFKWAYVLVNTRAVYIDPMNIISKNSSNISILSDSPSMALCPFLDMFNHHHLADTKVSVVNVQGQRFYELRTLTSFKRYEQFFISYGSHDNKKLLMEYGFFIPDNIFDCVRFCFREIVDILKLSFDERQYKFIKCHRLDGRDIYIGINHISFNLKAILFIAFHPEVLNYASVIFSETYPNDFDLMLRGCTKVLLDHKLGFYQIDVERLNCFSSDISEHLKLVKDFLDYRLKHVKKLKENKLL